MGRVFPGPVGAEAWARAKLEMAQGSCRSKRDKQGEDATGDTGKELSPAWELGKNRK